MSRVELAGGGPHDGDTIGLPLDDMTEVRLPHCAYGCPGPAYRYVRGLRVDGGRRRVVYLYAGEVPR